MLRSYWLRNSRSFFWKLVKVVAIGAGAAEETYSNLKNITEEFES